MEQLPPPSTIEQMYLAAILSELQALNELLAANLAPVLPVVGGGGDPDEIRLIETFADGTPKRKRGK